MEWTDQDMRLFLRYCNQLQPETGIDEILSVDSDSVLVMPVGEFQKMATAYRDLASENADLRRQVRELRVLMRMMKRYIGRYARGLRGTFARKVNGELCRKD